MLNNDPFGIIGFGGHAREVASYSDREVVFHAVDAKYLEGPLIDAEKPSTEATETPVVAAIGAPLLRKKMIEHWPGTLYTNVLSANCTINSDISKSRGLQVAPGVVIMPGCTIGNHVIINVAVTISHNCQIGDYVTVSPGAHIAGNVTIGDGVFIGIGAIISNDLTISEGSVIGAGSVVLEDVIEPNCVVVGVPGKVIKKNTEWLNAI